MTQDDAAPGRKGRATPSRKDAEAARKKAMKTPLTHKEQMRRERSSRQSLRQRQQEALRTGTGPHLPPRDRGPVRAYTRDVVDRRRNMAEYVLPVLLVALVASIVPDPRVQIISLYLWMILIVLVVVDSIAMTRILKRGLSERFAGESTKGAVGYAVLRSTQLRRFRLPPVAIERGAPLRDRY